MNAVPVFGDLARDGAPVIKPAVKLGDLAYYEKGETKFFPVEQVNYFKSEDKYVVVYHDDGHFLLNDDGTNSLKKLEQRYREAFVFAHRAYLVRTALIAGVKGNGTDNSDERFIRLRDGTKLPVARRRVAELRRTLRAGVVK